MFSGTLVDVIGATSGDVVSSADPERFVFDVRDVFKGEVRATQTVLTPTSGASCGFEISGPGPYLIFAFDDSTLTSGAEDDELYSHLCSGTRALADGGLATNLVASPPIESESAPLTSAPSGESAATAGGDGGSVWLPAAASGVALVLGVTIVWWVRRGARSGP